MAGTIGPYWVGDKPRDSIDIYIYRDGAQADLSGYTSAAVELEDPAGVAVDVSGVSVTKTNEKVTVTWPTAVSLFTVPGLYTLQVILKTATTAQHASSIGFQVQATADTPAAAWATLSNVAVFTGVTVDGPTLSQAQAVIELLTGIDYADTIDPDLPALSSRDLRKLKHAVAYQAAFIAQHEGLFSRPGVAALSQDGMSVSVATGTSGGVDQTALIVAPLAKVALRSLSWRRGGASTLHASISGARRGSLAALEDAWLRDEAGLTIWQPLGTPGRFDGVTTEWGS